MQPTSPILRTRIAELEGDLAAFSSAAARLARESSAPLTPHSPGVRDTYTTADALELRAETLQRLPGWDTLDPELQARGWRTMRTGLNAARTAAQLLGTAPVVRAEATTSVTHPASPASTQIWLDAARGADLPNVRIVGNITRQAAEGVAELFRHIPERVTQQLDAQGLRSTLFDGRLTDVWGFRHLRGKQPRGWPPGSTWDIVPGVGTSRGMAADPSRDARGKGHSTDSLSLHELAHVVDVAFAEPADDTVTQHSSWLHGPQAELRRLGGWSDYASAYPEEWFAEAFTAYTRTPASHADLQRRYPETHGYLAAKLGAARFS